MKANARAINSIDEGVSPVIAVILMVAITVVLAATVYVWVSGFANDDGGPESASATARGFDSDGDGDVDHIRVTLVRGENAPYSVVCTAVNGTDPSEGCTSAPYGAASEFRVTGTDGTNSITPDLLLTAVGPANLIPTNFGWSPGQSLFVECESATNVASITVAVGNGGSSTTILDTTVVCEQDLT